MVVLFNGCTFSDKYYLQNVYISIYVFAFSEKDRMWNVIQIVVFYLHNVLLCR